MTALSTPELRAILGDVTYLPGWELSVWEPDHYQGPYLTVITSTSDAANPAEEIELRIHSPIPPQGTRGDFLAWLLWRLKMIAIHEVLEWYRVDGRPWIDPHRDL